MSFLLLISVLIAERLLQPYLHLRQSALFERWFELHQSLPVGQTLRDGAIGLIGLLLLPLALIAIPIWLFGAGLFGIPGFLLAGLILLYSLGPIDLSEQVDRLCAAQEAGNDAGAKEIAAELADEADPQPPVSSLRVCSDVLLAAHRRIFAVIFWFLLLGPLGALGYRLARETRIHALADSRPGIGDAAARLLYWLDWIPARMLGGLFALGGNFESAVQEWKQCPVDERLPGGPALVAYSGIGALGLQGDLQRVDDTGGIDTRQVQSAMALVWRALVILVALCGIIAVSVWLS